MKAMNTQECFDKKKSPRERAEAAVKALGLDHGDGYGTAYYTSAHRMTIERAFETNPACSSFAELREALGRGRLPDSGGASDAELLAKLGEAASNEATG